MAVVEGRRRIRIAEMSSGAIAKTKEDDDDDLEGIILMMMLV
jgi:hypothetical protein